jgi:hypothetical protein
MNNASNGWDPGNNKTEFIINDKNFNVTDSIVFLNVHSANLGNGNNLNPSCDFYQENNATSFKINCVNPPNDGSALHYMIINH